MTENVDVLIVGAGQAGLAISYHLTRMKRNHLILEQASAITPAWLHNRKSGLLWEVGDDAAYVAADIGKRPPK